jgi:hypothetical protein
VTLRYVRKFIDHDDHGVRLFDVPKGYKLNDLINELEGYCNILLGREDPPVNAGAWTLMELVDAYHARAREIEMRIHTWEQEGRVAKQSPYYRFRTGQLRSFIEMCRMMIDMASRRITAAQMLAAEQ